MNSTNMTQMVLFNLDDGVDGPGGSVVDICDSGF